MRGRREVKESLIREGASNRRKKGSYVGSNREQRAGFRKRRRKLLARNKVDNIL